MSRLLYLALLVQIASTQDPGAVPPVPPPAGGQAGVPPPAGGQAGAPPPAGGQAGVPPPAGGQAGVPPPAGGQAGAPPPAGGQPGVPPPAGGQAGAPPPTPVKVENVAHKFGEKGEVHDTEHLKMHLEDKIDVEKEEWNPEKEMFHYFSMHDLNKDAVIDGLEIMKAITHDHSEHGTGMPKNPVPDETLETMVDAVLKDIDVNNDGLIDYGEYVLKQKTH